MHDDDRARRRRRTIFPKLWPVVLQSSIFPHKKKLLHLHTVSVSHQSRYFRWWCVSRIMVSSSSRVLFARVPSISFPVRMVDGVRVTGVQHSLASSSFPIPSTSSAPLSQTPSSESSSKGEAVVVSEEECEIVNVRLSLWSSWSSSSALLLFVF